MDYRGMFDYYVFESAQIAKKIEHISSIHTEALRAEL